MCNHNPITIHEHGGQTVVCANCLKVLKPWRANGESGQCLAICLLVLGGAFVAFFGWLIIVHLTGLQALADIIATVIFLAVFFGALKLCEGGGQ